MTESKTKQEKVDDGKNIQIKVSKETYAAIQHAARGGHRRICDQTGMIIFEWAKDNQVDETPIE